MHVCDDLWACLCRHLAYMKSFWWDNTHCRWVPEELLRQMFGSISDATEEGIGLVISRNMLKIMDGDVQYLRETERSSFIRNVEFASAGTKKT
ncbi:hypothetical protein Hanom_Chr13g01216441 [Helianthus anomalus]